MVEVATSSPKQLHDRFVRLEEAAGWWDLEAYGQKYWHQIRYGVFSALLQSHHPIGKPQLTWRDRPLSSWIRNVRPTHWAPAVRRSLWWDLDPADVLVINHPRHVRLGDEWVCPYTEPLLRQLDRSYWVLEDVWQGVHSHPQSGPRLKYLEWSVLTEQVRFLARHGLTGGRLSSAEQRQVRTWCETLQAELGGGPSVQRALSLTRAAVRELAALRRLYGALLARVEPKLIVLVVHYSYRCLPLTATARERGIPVAELQHGTLGETHLAYNVAPGRRPPGFPDYLLTFGDWWRDHTPGLPLAAEAAPAIGYAWLDAYAARTPRRCPAGNPRTVLFVSQGTIGPELSRLATELAARKPGAYRIRYKLHPGELMGWRERYPWLVGTDIQVIDEPTNIYDEFTQAETVVGVYSTALFEALAFGVAVVIPKLARHETMQPLADGGAATICPPEELARAIEEATPPPSEVRDALWRPNAAANFTAFVDQALGS
ncbi:MAG: hypothetical protein JRI23_32815 [Deltaproteobacteria bacterium]|jgi:hypothetical protein|nr:hypothetical protein [Deltaproteobacteria bacterium]MBW2537035.1 hypothetical protein [Deltaproteobacteria bacterium]